MQEVGFVVEGLSAERRAQVKSLRHLETKDALYLKPVEIFFNLFAVSPPGREPWSDEPLVGLRSLTDVSMANIISENILARGEKTYPIILKTDQGARYSMATSVAPLRMHVQVMNDIQLMALVPVRDRVGLSNSGVLPTIVRPEMTRDEWDGFYGELDWHS